MTRFSVRDVRLHWPKAEKALEKGEEILVTRDGRPVARLLPYLSPAAPPRKRFNARSHLAWLSRFWKSKRPSPSTDQLLSQDRAD